MSDIKRVSPARKALDYAENGLKVHEVYNEAIELLERQRESLSKQLKARDAKREVETQIADREMELTLDEAGKHESMSVAAMERHMKAVLHNDLLLGQLRAKLREVGSELDLAESSLKFIDSSIKVITARITELGGYLNYLAAARVQYSTNNTSEAGEAR